MTITALTRQRVYSALALVGFFVLWELACLAFGISDLILPRPSQVATVLVQKMPLLWPHTLQTLSTTLAGFALGVAVGILLGLLIWAWSGYRLRNPLHYLEFDRRAGRARLVRGGELEAQCSVGELGAWSVRTWRVSSGSGSSRCKTGCSCMLQHTGMRLLFGQRIPADGEIEKAVQPGHLQYGTRMAAGRQ